MQYAFAMHCLQSQVKKQCCKWNCVRICAVGPSCNLINVLATAHAHKPGGKCRRKGSSSGSACSRSCAVTLALIARGSDPLLERECQEAK